METIPKTFPCRRHGALCRKSPEGARSGAKQRGGPALSLVAQYINRRDIHVYMCMYIHTYIHTDRQTDRQTNMHIYIYMYECVCVCIYVYILLI